MKRIVLLVVVVVLLATSCTERSNEPLFRIKENGLYGFIDSTGVVKIKPQYKFVAEFSSDGYALVSNKAIYDSVKIGWNIYYGYIDKRNKLVIDTNNLFFVSNFNGSLNSLDAIYNLSYDLLAIRNNRFVFYDTSAHRFGYKDIKGNNNTC